VSTGDLDVLLARLAPEVAELVRAADALVHEVDPDVVRVVWPHQGTVGYGVGPAKNSEHYAYLATFARHLNLGFNHGASLDSGGLLEGTGKAFRKVTVRSADDLRDPRLVPLLRTARAERLTALGRA
jgi:hypothetical protein